MNLTRNPVLESLLRWLSSTEMFARPARQLPGKWRLYEFYSEPEGELQNMKEDEIKKSGYMWEIELESMGQFYQKMKLPVFILSQATHGTWNTSRNFLCLSSDTEPAVTVEFQYAIENGNLKILKKDMDGRILFFGFFRRLPVEE
ncbi:MAG: hypothetical protein ACOC11_03045 [Prolixibacteraceae bacterium]